MVLTLVRKKNAQHAYTDGHEDSHNEHRGQAEEDGRNEQPLEAVAGHRLSPILHDGQGELNRRLQSHLPTTPPAKAVACTDLLCPCGQRSTRKATVAGEVPVRSRADPRQWLEKFGKVLLLPPHGLC